MRYQASIPARREAACIGLEVSGGAAGGGGGGRGVRGPRRRQGLPTIPLLWDLPPASHIALENLSLTFASPSERRNMCFRVAAFVISSADLPSNAATAAAMSSGELRRSRAASSGRSVDVAWRMGHPSGPSQVRRTRRRSAAVADG